MQCAASAALPQVREPAGAAADKGTAIHTYITNAAAVGRDCALAGVPPEYRDACSAIDLDGLRAPYGDVQWESEVALAFDTATGKARELGRNIGRDYRAAPTEIVGTADLIGAGHDRLVIVDIKTGRAEQAPAAEHWQLRTLAAIAARLAGCSQAEVAIAQLHSDGTWRHDRATLYAIDLEGDLDRLVTLHERVTYLKLAVAAGRQVDVTMGPHCQYCPSLPHCPGQMALVKALPETVEAASKSESLTPELAAQAWQALVHYEALTKRLRAGLEAYARQYPFALPDGRVVRETETTREYVNGKVALRVLTGLGLESVADQAIEPSTSKAALRECIASYAKERGQSVKAAIAEVLDAVQAAGGITATTTKSVRASK